MLQAVTLQGSLVAFGKQLGLFLLCAKYKCQTLRQAPALYLVFTL